MRPLFSIWTAPVLTVFWSSTRPVYFSLESSLSMASRFHLGLPAGERTPCFSKPAAIFQGCHQQDTVQISCALFQFTIRIDRVSVALTFCHFGTAILKPFPETFLDCLAFLYHIHYNFPPTNKNTAVKLLRHKGFMRLYIKVDRLPPWCNLSTYHAIRVQNRFFIQTIVNASALAKATLRRSLRIITTPNHPDFWCPKQPLPIHATCPEGLFCPEDRAYSQRPG